MKRVIVAAPVKDPVALNVVVSVNDALYTGEQTILTAAEVPVVFVTAFPERLLTGETLEPAFVVTKPFDAAALKVAISQALFFSSKA